MVTWCVLYDMLSGICIVSYVGIHMDGSVGCRLSRDSGEAESLKGGMIDLHVHGEIATASWTRIKVDSFMSAVISFCCDIIVA